MKLENKYIAIQTLKACKKEVEYYWNEADFNDSDIEELLEIATDSLILAIKHISNEIDKDEAK